MIHRDFCDPTYTRHYSPLRMQFHFLLSRYVCWDGFVPLTRKEMANLLNCNLQSINKFIKKGVRENILSIEGDRLFLLKRVDDYSTGYVKHFAFLDSVEFVSLNIHTQRFILYTLWAGVYSGRPLKREISSLYHSGKEKVNGVLNLYSKAPIYDVLKEAKKFLKLDFSVEDGKEIVRVSGVKNPYAKAEVNQNQGERKLLNKVLEKQGSDEVFSERSCQEILKVKRTYFKTLQSIGLELFSHGLQKLLSVYKLSELNSHQQVGVYLRSIVKDLGKQSIPKLKKQVEYIKRSIFHAENLSADIKVNVINSFQFRLDRLNQAIEILDSSVPTTTTYNSSTFPFFNWLETN